LATLDPTGTLPGGAGAGIALSPPCATTAPGDFFGLARRGDADGSAAVDAAGTSPGGTGIAYSAPSVIVGVAR